MAPKIQPIEELNPKKEMWRIAVRIVRLWTTTFPNSDTKSIEMVLVDSKASSIFTLFIIVTGTKYIHMIDSINH